MELPSLEELGAAARIVYRSMLPTPTHAWPLLRERMGTPIYLKHENHTPVGAFKIRGGLVYFDALRAREPGCTGVICATRGNHGQSVGLAARRAGLAATIVVPRGNSVEKNAAMRALGVTLIEHGDDFQASREHAQALAQAQGLHMVPSFHRDLLLGVASYWLEFFSAVPKLDTVFVPIGQGSGICAAIAARKAMGLRCKIVGVVSAQAPAYALSFAARRAIDAPVSTELADGMACRVPDPQALALILEHVDDIVQVSDDEVGAAMKQLFVDTHNVAEGAGAAAFAAAYKIRARLQGQTVGAVVSGGNVDHDVFARVLLQGESARAAAA